MNLRLKQLCVILCGISIFGQAIAAPNNTSTLPTSSSNSASASNSKNSTSNGSSSGTSDDKVVLNFENADIQTVIKAISKLSGKNFVIDPRVKGTVNIVSEKPISKAESYKVLESALRMQGFATVEADGVIKVLPETDARTYGMRTETEASKHNPGDQLVTKIFIIDNGSATQLANALRPMISPNNAISVYPNSNALVVTDYSSNMSRITKIITDLNTTKAKKVAPAIVRLKYAYASDVAQTLQSYAGNGSMGSGSGGGASGGANDGPTTSITVDPASNSVIINSNVAAKVEELRALALSLDKDTSSSNNNLHVVYLRNADAAHVAEVLKTVASGQDNPDMTASAASRALSDTSSVFQGSGGGSSGGGANLGGGSSGNKSPSTANRSNSNSGSTNNDKNAPKIFVQAEPSTNSLIIQAPDAVYRNMRSIIDMLDVRRVQVMIEALIADVSTNDTGTFGIQWLGGAGNNNVGGLVLSNYGGNGSSVSNLAQTAIAAAGVANGGTSGAAAAGSGLSVPGEVYVGLVTGTTTIGGQTVPGISALADMLASTNAGNILGRPTLLTLDNEEASIFVGQNIGIPTGSFQNTGNAAGNIVSQVNRQDVGTVLRLKPLVTQSGIIQMSVYQEDSIVDSSSQSQADLQANGPNINKRNLKTQILVNDGQIIALGGMTQDIVSLQSAGIPLLSSIPYLGWLFSWQSRTHTKTNLVIFLRPVIIRNEEGMKALTNQRYRYIMQQQNSIKAVGNALLPNIDAVNIENQVPYDNKVPPQPSSVPVTPILDVTKGPNNVSVVNSSPGQAPIVVQSSSTSAKNAAISSSNNTDGQPKVIQTAPNSITITNNNNQ